MAEFEVKIRSVKIEEHPDADAIEIAQVDDYRSVVRKGQFQTGDLAAYIPENSVLPDSLVIEMGLQGKLAGAESNRVKAIRLRGVLSQGLIWPVPGAVLGDNVAEQLGITKYIPQVPHDMQGEMYPAPGMTISFDIEDIKKYPKVLYPGEEIVATEKLHGTYCQLGYYEGQPIITSKTPAHNGVAYFDNEPNQKNIYVQIAHKYQEQLEALSQIHQSYYLMGEIYGRGVQDLQYETTEKQFRVFDFYVGAPTFGRYLDYDEMVELLKPYFDIVPLVYRGEYQPDQLEEITSGQSKLASHRREGIVIKPIHERIDLELGRVLVKSISSSYLLRRGKTTEFE